TWDFTMHVMPPGPAEAGGEMAGQGQEGGMTMPMKITYKRENKLRMDFMEPDGAISMSSCYDGENGWHLQMGQRIDMNQAQLQETEVMTTTWLDGFLDYKDKGFVLELLPDETMDGQNYFVLHSTDKYANVQKFYVNASTHLIERQVGDMTNFVGEMEAMYMTFKDYETIDGYAMARHVAQFKQDGQMLWEATLKDVAFNTGVEDEVFMAEAMTMK
ncbi:MAG: hypothetical protein O7G31_16365, partial [Calditrichaeota bacterium]|nr:hypothetical protein [Calditrichota bacterium]